MLPLEVAHLALPDGMRADVDVLAYIRLLDKTMRAEKVSDPSTWTLEERNAYVVGDWKSFSRLRGYSIDEIDDFEAYLELCRALVEKYGEDDVQWISFAVQEQTGILELAPREILEGRARRAASTP